MSGWSVRCPETGKAIALVHLGAPLSDPALRKVLKSHCRAQRRAAHNALHLSFQRCWYSAESPSRYLANSPGIARKAPRDRVRVATKTIRFFILFSLFLSSFSPYVPPTPTLATVRIAAA